MVKSVPLLTLKTRLLPPPSIVNWSAPSPLMVSLLSIANSPILRLIVPPLRLESKSMVSLNCARAIASRKDKSPSLKSPSFSSSRVETTSSLGITLASSITVCSSNAPMSVPLPTVRLKSRWSLDKIGAKKAGSLGSRLLPASIAGESSNKAKVWVSPPLSCSSPNLASRRLSLVPTKSVGSSKPTAPLLLPIRLFPRLIKVPPASLNSGKREPSLLAIIVLLTLAVLSSLLDKTKS